jgi:hypothetical protein
MLRRLRHDWPVRWAHHPLCARHRHETWRIGRLHLCRGCSSLALGALAGVSLVSMAGGPWCTWALLALAPPVVWSSWPPRYRRLPRACRDLLRAGSGFVVVFAFWSTWHFPAQSWPALPILYATWRAFVPLRARLQARACDGCPELGAGGVCSGYALHAASVRAIEAQLERELEGSLAGSGRLPRWLPREP